MTPADLLFQPFWGNSGILRHATQITLDGTRMWTHPLPGYRGVASRLLIATVAHRVAEYQANPDKRPNHDRRSPDQPNLWELKRQQRESAQQDDGPPPIS